jgi:endoglucanase
MDRRKFVSTAVGAGALAAAAPRLAFSSWNRVRPVQLPRWRGFNITEKVSSERQRPFVESDFAWMAEFGFDFARIPLSYWVWSDPESWYEIDKEALKQIDDVVEYGDKYGIHISMNFHRIPGYCVNRRDLEPMDLFTGPAEEQAEALKAARYHWEVFAERYKRVPSERLSFDLFNEPPWSDSEDRYVVIANDLVEGIRSKDPDRLIIADGLDIGQTPVYGIVDLDVGQSTRGYLPKMVSHYTATWVPENEFESFEKPTWPMVDKNGVEWNKEVLREKLIEPWRAIADEGVGIHVGEWGCYNKTPHDVALAWMGDLLSLWKEAGWGYAMWNFRGSFGILDSGREDVEYEDFRGHKLDRKMLNLMLEY